MASDVTLDVPSVLVFDVNETLSDLSPLRARMSEVGLPADQFTAWFAAVLRDGFAVTLAGGYAEFADLARDALRAVAERAGVTMTADAADHVVGGFTALDVHPDVPEGIRALHTAGLRLVTMTNGTTSVTEALLERAGLRDRFEMLLDVRGPRRWKPAPEAYRYAVTSAGVRPAEAMLVAVHPWDTDGAIRAGLGAAWLHRGSAGSAYPRTMATPTWRGPDLVALAAHLAPAGR